MTEATSAAPVLHAAFRSDPGRVRTNNEDVPLLDPDRGVYGVIDGVGGQAAGELAAAIACEVILQRLARPLGTAAERVREAIAIANNEIFRRAGLSQELAGMTCVVTLAIVAEGRLTIGHVGDSRLYKLRPGGIQKLTHDHSPVGEREDAQELSEIDAMRHPRRHEVFRDVGGAFRDKDEDDYVEVSEQPLERDAAILLCSDGLTDMVPSTTIERVVRQHAGDPDAVVAALIDAANEAGGRDNVTVVYAEGEEFAQAIRRQTGNAPAAHQSSGVQADTARDSSAGNGFVRAVRWVVRSRTTWFALGTLIGIAGALLLVWRAGATETPATRTIAVAQAGAAPFLSLPDALRDAKPGDTVQLEPGTYAERVALADGVSLVARVPGSVRFVRPAGLPGGDAWVAITAGGELGGRISGIRVESTADLPVDVAIRLAGQTRAVDLVEMAGPMQSGVELLPGTSATLSGLQFAVTAPALAVGERGQVVVGSSVFLRTGRGGEPPILLNESAQATLQRNVFIGFGTEILKGGSAADRQQIPAANVILSADPPRKEVPPSSPPARR